MAQNREIGEIGQIVTVDTSANSMTVNGSIILGNSSSNVVINSSAISFGGVTQTDKSYTWTNTHTFTNTVSIAALSANGTLGISSQVLTTNGTGIYWSSAGVNTNATYTWSNAHTFNGIVTFSQTAIGTVNNSLYLGGTVAASYQLNSTLNANIASYLPTYTGVVNGSSHTVGTAFTANATVVNAVSYYAGTTLIGNTTGPYGKTEATLNVNSSVYANSSSTNTFTIGTAAYHVSNGNFGVGTSNPGANFLDSAGANVTTASLVDIRPGATAVGGIVIGSTSRSSLGTEYRQGFFLRRSDGWNVNKSGMWKGSDSNTSSREYWEVLNIGNEGSGGHIVFTTANAENLRITAAGNVGIGTTTPNAKLEVNGSINATSFYAGTTLIGNTTGPYGKTETTLNVNSALTSNNSSYLGGTSAASYALKADVHYIGTTSVALNRASASLALTGITSIDGTANNSTYAFGKTEGNLNVNSATYATSSSTNTFTIGTAAYHVSNGNFGVGTNSPTSKLQVNGSSPQATIVNDSGSGIGRLNITSTTNDTYQHAGIGLSNGSVTCEIMHVTPGAMAFANPSGSERMRIASNGNIGIGTTTPRAILDVANTTAMIIPTGTTAQRPTGIDGMIRYNTDTVSPEYYSASYAQWIKFKDTPTYTIYYVIVGGGGGGGYGSGGDKGGAGGGAGGMVTGSMTVSSTSTYSVGVGGGGGAAASGSQSSIAGASSPAYGGGQGGYGAGGGPYNGTSGGSGGGAVAAGGAGGTPGSGTAGQGNRGGNNPYPNNGSGGGGAGAVGGDNQSGSGGNGGAGSAWAYNSVTYAGGGGGGAYSAGGSSGGSGIGGAGRGWNGGTGGSGTASTGSGGGGGGGNGGSGGSGAGGVVVIAYPSAVQLGSGGTVTTGGGYYYHTFTSSGTYTA